MMQRAEILSPQSYALLTTKNKAYSGWYRLIPISAQNVAVLRWNDGVETESSGNMFGLTDTV